MSLANISLFIPNIEEDTTSNNSLLGQLKELQQVLQSLPPELEQKNEGFGRRFSFRSPLSRKSKKTPKSGNGYDGKASRPTSPLSGLFKNGSPLSRGWSFRKSKSPKKQGEGRMMKGKRRLHSSQDNLPRIADEKDTDGQAKGLPVVKRAYSFGDEVTRKSTSKMENLYKFSKSSTNALVVDPNNSGSHSEELSSDEKTTDNKTNEREQLAQKLLGENTEAAPPPAPAAEGAAAAIVSSAENGATADVVAANNEEGAEAKGERPTCEGILYVQGSSQWKRRWCRYKDGILECRYEKEAGALYARILVGYCMPEIMDANRESNNDDLYWCYLESQQADSCFKIYSPDRIFSFRAETSEECMVFADTITRDLQATLPEELWARKTIAAQEICPLSKQQFLVSMNNHQKLLNSLSTSGFLQSYLPITSMNKEKSGVLAMEVEDGWRDYYFVLFEGSLYYYQDSKSTTPNGFITLRYAEVQLDEKSLSQGDFVFHIITPLRRVSCKTRHSVALSEWVHSLEISISKNKLAPKERKRSSSSKANNIDLLTRRSSHDILANINQMLVDINTLEALCKNQAAMETFVEWLADSRIGGFQTLEAFDFYRDNERLKDMSRHVQGGVSPDSVVAKADKMFNRYISEFSEERLEGLPKDVLDQIRVELQRPTGGLFKEVEKLVLPELRKAFEAFKQSSYFEKLRKKLTSKTVMDQRDVDEFEPETVQSFMLKPKGKKRTIEIKLPKRANKVTIGRDKSNFVVIEDSRVSRSHARVEYSATKCEYIDLGSSCGSKLNGRNVLRAKLKPGDMIEIGWSVLIFRVRKRRKSSIFQRLVGLRT
mmetsp:Transcript_30710/g.42943  ORF Transcript_30710/g.42943 Transcript_30710/m.42943 type:complete len:828 (+) Transcript_30710:227-2710(+)